VGGVEELRWLYNPHIIWDFRVVVPIVVNMKTASTLSFFHPKDKQHVSLTCLHIYDEVLEFTSLETANFNSVF
jgi:hypothetical protein